jgi:hypothetical protein
VTAALLPAAANFAWSAMNAPAHSRFRRALRNPRLVQERLLLDYVRRNADSAFGLDHQFDRIDSVAAFQDCVPLRDYDGFSSYIDRTSGGEANVLTAEPVIRLATSSGSTAARKLIPYTRGLQREFNRAIGPWIVDLYRSDPLLARGCAYWSITPVAQSPRDHRGKGPPVGFEEDSAYLGGVWKRMVDATMAVPGVIRHITDVPTFRYVTLRLLLAREDLRLISVWHPSFLELLLDDAAREWDRLAADIARGDLSPPRAVDPNIAAELRRFLKPAPERAADLRRCGPARWDSVWPKLRLISCWGDAHAELPCRSLTRRFRATRLQAKGLLATEAFVTIPFANRRPLAIRSHFFEFVTGDGNVRLAHELELGRRYGVVVTTAGGLWRYKLGDEVEVEGFVDQTPSLRFVGRRDRVVDHFGEKLSETFVAGVLGELLRDRNASFAMLAPDPTGAGFRYTLFLECTAEAAAAAASMPKVAARLDELLRANPHYAYCRDLRQLDPTAVFLVPRGAYATYSRAHEQIGMRWGDIKPQALSQRTDWARVFDGEYAAG